MTPDRHEAGRPEQAFDQQERLRRARRLTEMLAELLSDSDGSSVGPLATVSDYSEMSRIFESLQNRATTQVRILDRPPYPSPPTELLEVTRRKRGEGVEFRCICDTYAFATPGGVSRVRAGLAIGMQFRLLTEPPCKMIIADAAGALVAPAGAGIGVAVLVDPSPLLDILISVHETLWNLATPFHDGTSAAEVSDPLAAEEHELIAMLAAGTTEEAIARRMGISLRTVQRRIQHLMNRLGAITRFQAGVNAAKRGWF